MTVSFGLAPDWLRRRHVFLFFFFLFARHGNMGLFNQSQKSTKDTTANRKPSNEINLGGLNDLVTDVFTSVFICNYIVL